MNELTQTQPNVKNQVEKNLAQNGTKVSVEQTTSAMPDNTSENFEIYLISHCWKTSVTKIKTL